MKIRYMVHLTHVYHEWQSYNVWFLRYGAWRTEFFVILDRFLPFYFSFWAIFCSFTPLTTQKKLKKTKKKTPGDIIILHMCIKNYDHVCTVAEIWCATDEQTDRRKKWYIEVGAPPENHKNRKNHGIILYCITFPWEN